jgi:hypothetical protein
MKIDFEDVGAVLGKCHNGRVFELVTIIELKLEIISMECCTKKASKKAYPFDISAAFSYGNH